jgi:HPt (histidine-containing phosphotransfer) domain-containing protein
MNQALARLWVKFLPQIEERVAVLEAAARALAAGSLSVEQREAAHAAAHKLAGSLGTFGLLRGTELAREAELLLADEVQQEPAAQLARSVSELRLVLENRKAS